MHHNLLLQVNFLPLDVTLDDDATHPAVSVVSGPLDSDLHVSVTSLVNTGAATADTHIVDSVSCISECHGSIDSPPRTRTWMIFNSPFQ